MFTLINKLQQKSERERRRFGLMVSGVITGVIFLIWLGMRIALWSSETPPLPEEVTPLSLLGEDIVETYQGVRDEARERQDFRDLSQALQEELREEGQGTTSETGASELAS